MPSEKCDYCDRKLIERFGRAKYCNDACKQAAYRDRKTRGEVYGPPPRRMTAAENADPNRGIILSLSNRLAKFRHRAKALGVESNLNVDQIMDLALYYNPNGKCSRCNHRGGLTIDHVIPLTRGGTNTIDNIQLLCFSCNTIKKANSDDYRPDKGEFARSLSVLQAESA